MSCRSTLLISALNIALSILTDIEPSLAMQFEFGKQAVSGAPSELGQLINDTTHAPQVDWTGKNKSPETSVQDDTGESGGSFDYTDRKPPRGGGLAGDMVYMLPLFTLMDRLSESNNSAPIISWPLKTGEKKVEVSEGEQASSSDSQIESESVSLLPPAKLPRRSEREDTPPEGSDHIHIGQGKCCPAPGCNNGPCCCSECEAISIQATGQKRLLDTASDATSAKKEKLSTADELPPEVVGNTEPIQEQSTGRSNNAAGRSTNIVQALFRRQATGSSLVSLLDQALYSQFLLRAALPVQPVAVLNDDARLGQLVVLCDTRFVTWGNEPYLRIWTEEMGEWASVVQTIVKSWFQAIAVASCSRFFTWTDDGSIRLWTEVLGEWTDVEITNQAGTPGTLSVLSDGQVVASSGRHLSVWSEADGVWSSTELEIGSENITRVLVLREGGFMSLSREKPYFIVRLWTKEEGGWTSEIYFQTTGMRLASTEVRGMDGCDIEDIAVFNDGEILLLIRSLWTYYSNSGAVGEHRRFIWTDRSEHWVEFSRWRKGLDSYPDEYKFLADGQIITWNRGHRNTEEYQVFLRTEQPGGEWLSSEVIESDTRWFQADDFLQLRDGRIVIKSGDIFNPTLIISIINKENCSTVKLACLDRYVYEMVEIRAGLLATSHGDGTIRLWDLYHPFQTNSGSDQGASE